MNMIEGPFLVAIVPGVIVLLLTWWLRKKDFPLFVRNAPGILTLLVAITLFYIGFVRIRGFEGGAYGILAFFLLLFSIVSFFIAKPQKHK
ncbi:YesK family protein [Halobacillus sp. MO56]